MKTVSEKKAISETMNIGSKNTARINTTTQVTGKTREWVTENTGTTDMLLSM